MKNQDQIAKLENILGPPEYLETSTLFIKYIRDDVLSSGSLFFIVIILIIVIKMITDSTAIVIIQIIFAIFETIFYFTWLARQI